jgi:hypothetical protein
MDSAHEVELHDYFTEIHCLRTVWIHSSEFAYSAMNSPERNRIELDSAIGTVQGGPKDMQFPGIGCGSSS